MKATSPLLNETLRSEAEARTEMFERDDKYHRKALEELLEAEKQARLRYLNCGNTWNHLSMYDNRIHALNYALEALTNAAAERIKNA